MQFIDTHQHLILPESLRYGWTNGIRVLAGRRFAPEDYAALAGDAVQGALAMEAGVDDAFYQAEARLVAGLIGQPQGVPIIAQIASCRPEAPGFEAWLDECAALKVAGFRRILHVVPDALSRSARFRRNLRRIGQRGLTFDLCLRADQHQIGEEILRACPDQRFILDHCGNPDIAGEGFRTWAQSLARLAGFPHLAIKLSGITANARSDQQNAEVFRPYFETVLRLFGTDRVLWGGDWPVCNLGLGLPGWIETSRHLLASLSQDEQRAIAQGNALRIYLQADAPPDQVDGGRPTDLV
jgi:predicted TIM-barrel fold metal-dependent hydrolase